MRTRFAIHDFTWNAKKRMLLSKKDYGITLKNASSSICIHGEEKAVWFKLTDRMKPLLYRVDTSLHSAWTTDGIRDIIVIIEI